jgi:hypothetical protein
VRDVARNQARAQVFRGARAHGVAPPQAPQPPTPTPTPPPAAPRDSDGDGTLDGQDCAPSDASIHPKAADLPDLAFVDSNCDGLDGVEKDAVFASAIGSDSNPGTRAAPKRQIQAAVTAAAGKARYVLATEGVYGRVEAATGVSVYGGYDTVNWSRKTALITFILGSPEGVFADGAKGRHPAAADHPRQRHRWKRLRGSRDQQLQPAAAAGHHHRRRRRSGRRGPERCTGPSRERWATWCKGSV